MPFRSRPEVPRDLHAQIHAELRERLEDAVDMVALEVLVETRRARSEPAPAADNPGDRTEYETGVLAFLERLAGDLGRDLDARRQMEAAAAQATDGARAARLVAGQLALARALPDYWQRFEAIRLAYTAERLSSARAQST